MEKIGKIIKRVLGIILVVVMVLETDWYYEAVSYVYYKGLMGNVSSSNFGVGQSFVRIQLPIVLHRFCGTPEVEYIQLFPDVSETDWFAEGLI